MAGLRDDPLFAELGESDLAQRMRGNHWIYACLLDARRAAAIYLRDLAVEFAAPIAAALRAAAGAFEALVDGLGERPVQEIAPSPWQLAPGAWSREMRHAQAARLARAFPLEHQAFSIVGEASALAAA